MMDEETLKVIEEYIEAIIDEKVDEALGRDSLYSCIRRAELRKKVLNQLPS